jgi:hypothetical protein
MKLEYTGKVREMHWRSFMARFTTIAKLVGVSDIEAYHTLLDAVPNFIKLWIEQDRVSRKYKRPHAHIFVGSGVTEKEVNTLITRWFGESPRNVTSLDNGKFDIEFRHQETVEKLLAKRGSQVNEDGRKLEVLIPPFEVSLVEILEMVAEKLEVQDEKDSFESRKPQRQYQRRVEAEDVSDDEGKAKQESVQAKQNRSNSQKANSPAVKPTSQSPRSAGKGNVSRSENVRPYVPPNQFYQAPPRFELKGGKGGFGPGYNQGKGGFSQGPSFGKGNFYTPITQGKGYTPSFDQGKGKGKGKGGRGASGTTQSWNASSVVPKPPPATVGASSSPPKLST